MKMRKPAGTYSLRQTYRIQISEKTTRTVFFSKHRAQSFDQPPGPKHRFDDSFTFLSPPKHRTAERPGKTPRHKKHRLWQNRRSAKNTDPRKTPIGDCRNTDLI